MVLFDGTEAAEHRRLLKKQEKQTACYRGKFKPRAVSGGLRKITLLIWNRYVLFQSIERKAWQQHFQSIIVGLNP